MLNTLLGRTTESPEVKAARLRVELAQTELILAQSGHNEGAIFNSDTGRSTGESGLFDDDDVESAADNDSATLLGATIHYSVNRESQAKVPRARARRWLPFALTSTRSVGNTECSNCEDLTSSDKNIEMSSFEVDEVNRSEVFSKTILLRSRFLALTVHFILALPSGPLLLDSASARH